jgi:hypothetical protein
MFAMDRQSTPKRIQRLREIAHEVGAVMSNFDLTPLLPPKQLPSFMVPDDVRKADAILGQLRIEEAALKPQPRRLGKGFGKSQKQGVFTYSDLYQALTKVIEDNGLSGVLQILLKRFKEVEGNVNVARKGTTGMLKRVRGREEQEERGNLLQMATGTSRLDFVQLLAPLADQTSLDQALRFAVERRHNGIIEVLVRYGKLSSW